MRSIAVLLIFCFFIGGLMLSGCGEGKKQTVDVGKDAKKVIDTALSMKSDNERTTYLVSQARGFYEKGEYQNAIGVSEYILNNLDANLASAKDILEKSKSKLK